MAKKIIDMSVKALADALKAKDLASKDIVKAYYEQIDAVEPSIGAYISLTKDIALSKAEEIDKRRAAGEELGALAGVPVAIKDNICTAGTLTTCASKILSNFVPTYDATVIEKLTKENMIMLGKLNMDEFAMGSTTENSFFKKTHNPSNTAYVPGGSSGGSAAAVAAKETPFALGSDTGGSIRQPAAFCGVVGLKPTYGTVSRFGLVAFASSLDQIGPVTRNVEDSAIVLNAIRGYDKMDSTSVNREYENASEDIYKGVKGLRIALPKEYFAEGINVEVKESILQAAKEFEKQGAVIVETSMNTISYALPAYYVISSAEASSNLARFDGVKYGVRSKEYTNIDELYKLSRSEGFGKEVKRRIMLGSFALSSGYYDAYYKKALEVRTLVVRDFSRVFEQADVILSPVAPTTAYKLGEKSSNPIEMYLGDIYTVPVNIAGLPAVSIPCGTDKKGLPIGMQLIGKAFDEKTLIRTAYAYETAGGDR